MIATLLMLDLTSTQFRGLHVSPIIVIVCVIVYYMAAHIKLHYINRLVHTEGCILRAVSDLSKWFD